MDALVAGSEFPPPIVPPVTRDAEAGGLSHPPMIYQWYQAQVDALYPIRMLAKASAATLRAIDIGAYTPPMLRHAAAACELLGNAGLTHQRPPFGLDTVRVGNLVLDVVEEAADATPFGKLLHFRKVLPDGVTLRQPPVLLVAPMSGHFATLLRSTVRVLLPEHDLYITDWQNARDTPLADGRFSMDEFIDHIIRFLGVLGPRCHVVAVCQPVPAVLAAAAIMAQSNHPAQPRSMTLMAGPVDTRINPTKVNELASGKPIEWFAENLIGTVPWRYHGAGRRVYPGFVQLSAFMAMNLDRHVNAHLGQFRNLVGGDSEKAKAHRNFYNEYGAVMDLPAEFYLETVQRLFQDHDLPLGRLTWHGEPVRPEAIRRTAILTVEGERDDICSIGQTMAALDLCTGVRPAMKRNHLQTGVGHYGVFSGRRWAMEIYPLVREVIQTTS